MQLRIRELPSDIRFKGQIYKLCNLQARSVHFRQLVPVSNAYYIKLLVDFQAERSF